MRESTRKIIFLLCVFAVAAIAGGTSWVALTLRKSIPPVSGPYAMPGVESPIDITYDGMGIPQVWAKSDRDACFAVGWLHASDRLFQMDLTRRLSQGRLSELLGDYALEMDKQQRTIGHHRLAKAALAHLSETNRTLLQAYADGVNAYIAKCSALPFEYYLLGNDCEPWTVYDCLSIQSFQTWYANFLQNNEDTFLGIVGKVGPEKARSLILQYPGWSPVTVPESSPETGQHDGTDLMDFFSPWRLLGSTVVKSLNSSGLTPFSQSLASNGWVVSPSKSASGKAILSSDPHLEISRLPQFWYLLGVHVTTDTSGVLGITAPGLPFVIMGHNSKAAWCFTVGGVDVIDYYRETINPDDSAQYKTANGWQPFEVIPETINVRGESTPVIERVRVTQHGPIVSSATDSLSRYAVRWAGFDVDLDVAATSGFALPRVAEFESFRRIVTNLGALDANWMYADSAGNIGYQLGTPIPVRPPQAIGLPLDGADSSSKWLGYRPLEETPHAYNPDRGWLATCNNKSERSQYPIPGNYAIDRIIRISHLLDSHQSFSPADMKRFQLDDTNVYFLRWKEPLVKALKSAGKDFVAQAIAEWDGSCALNSREAPVMLSFIYRLKEVIFNDEIEGLARRISTSWLDQIYHDSASSWFDNVKTDSIRETREICSRIAAEDALTDVAGRSLREMQTLTMNHPFSRIPVLSSLLNLSHGPWPRGGSAGTLNASFSSVKENGFEVVAGASWRFVLDFANIDSAQMVIPSGNSGHPMSSYFMNFNPMWRSGEYWTVPYSENAVRAVAVRTVTLTTDTLPR
ncbi:MAG: penicillin acylase family protein [Candidatus Zixiibacteriota bacterium]